MERNEKIALFRSRFQGRQDVYGRGWVTYREGKQVRGFSPACENFYTPGCHIKLKDGIPCSQCLIKEYQVLGDTQIEEHINGQESLLIYLLQTDGTVNFAALDFDMKPEKKELGHSLEDVLKVSALFNQIGLSHGIARSTGLGHHLYVFFSTPVEAYKIRSVFYWAFAKVGFIAEVESSIRPLPEIFPKQGSTDGGLGNGIKPPMIEPNFANERNCFITELDQWEYLKSIPTISLQQLEDIITKEGINVQVETQEKKYGGKNAWAPPTAGAIHKVLDGCTAFSKLKQRCAEGKVPTHDEGFALWHMCMHVADGEDWFLKNVPGWGQTEAQLKQLQQSKDKNYKPWSCKVMQDKGVCVVGTKCFDKKPPLIITNGVVQEDKSVPEAEWPSPSPYRYAVSRNEVSLSKLFEYIDELHAAKEDSVTKRLKLNTVISKAIVLDDAQQEALKDKIEKTGLYKSSQIKKQLKEAKKEQQEKVQEELKGREDTIIAGSGIYKRSSDPYGYYKIKGLSKEGDVVIPLTDFVLDIEEERVFIDDNGSDVTRWYVGTFKNSEAEIKFEIEAFMWENTQNFATFFSNRCGSHWVVAKGDLDEVKLVSMAAAKKSMYNKKPITQKQFCNAPGWHKGSYYMPSVIIDKTSVRPNTEMPINMAHKEHATQLDFSILGDDDLNQVLMHIKRDLFASFPFECVYNAIGIAMMASVIRHLNLPYTPTLWFEGESGAGKTALCMLMQQFYGNFRGPLNWGTTYVSMVNYGYDFKDCLLLVDDYKEFGSHTKAQICQQVVQHSYQYSTRGASQKDGKQRETKASRCMFMMTGEETPVNETSFIARLLLIYYPKHDTVATKDSYDKCVETSKFYNGVTPMFIKYVLNKKASDIQERFKALVKEHKCTNTTSGNADRIAYNLAMGRIGWELFLGFMKEQGTITAAEEDKYTQDAYVQSVKIQVNAINRCQEEQNSYIFTYRIAELLISGVFGITDSEQFGAGDIKIGVMDKDDKSVAYFLPATIIDEIKKRTMSSLTLNQSSLAAQLKSQGVLYPGNNSNTVQKRIGGSVVRVWKVNLQKLGLVAEKETSRGPSVVTPIHPNIPMEEGIFYNQDSIA